MRLKRRSASYQLKTERRDLVRPGGCPDGRTQQRQCHDPMVVINDTSSLLLNRSKFQRGKGDFSIPDYVSEARLILPVVVEQEITPLTG